MPAKKGVATHTPFLTYPEPSFFTPENVQRAAPRLAKCYLLSFKTQILVKEAGFIPAFNDSLIPGVESESRKLRLWNLNLHVIVKTLLPPA